MSEETEIYGETIESVKIERNSRGFTFSARAMSPERALEMYDQVKAETDARLAAEQG